MPKALARATCTLAVALLVASCVEVNVRRTVGEDRSGRQTLTVRAAKGAIPGELFPGSFSGATVLPVRTEANGARESRTADAVYADVTAVRYRVGFLHSATAIEPGKGGTLRYRETLGNGYLNSRDKAPDAARREAIVAETLNTRAKLKDAALTYTVAFPGKVLKSNADRVTGNEATWLLTVDRLFQHRTLDLTAEYVAEPDAAVAAAPRAEPRRIAAPAPREAIVAPALAPRAAPRVAAEPRPIAAPLAKAEPKLDGMLLAEAGGPPAAAPVPKPTPKTTGLEDEAADDDATKKVKEIFRQALVALDQKNYEQAAKLLQQALAIKPDSVVVANLYKVAVGRFLEAASTSKNPELKAAAEKLLLIAKEGRVRQLRDPKYIEQLVESLAKGFLPRTFAIEELIIAGDYSVPHLIAYIKREKNPETRAYAGYIMQRLGPIAVPAIAECLKVRDPLIKQIVIQALETIADPRSVPMLLWTAQDAKGNPLVVSAASKAIMKIAKDEAIFRTHSPIAFLALAERYYEKDRRVLLPHLYEHLVWRWKFETETLVSESVPEPLYAYRMAEEACRNALIAEATFEPAAPLIICCYYAQRSFLEDFFLSIKGRKLTPELAKEAELAKPILDRLKAAPLVGHAGGKRFLYAALRRSLRDGRTDVAVACINALETVADGSALPKPPPPPEVLAAQEAARKRGGGDAPRKRGRTMLWWGQKPEEKPEEAEAPKNPYAIELGGKPLIDALSYTPHRKVRYRAAEAIIHMNPHHQILDAEKVLINLSEALAETAERVALLVDDDEIRADQIRGLLRDVAVIPVLARDQASALERAKELPPKDLLIISAGIKDVDVATMLASLRRIYTLAATPTLIVTTKGDLPALRKQFAKENVGFLTTPFDKESVQIAIDTIFAKAPDSGDPSFIYSTSAARTLTTIDPATSIFKLTDALPALLRCVVSRTYPDSVRIPAALAIRHARSARAVPYLVNAYKDDKTSKKLRIGIIDALGWCAASLQQPSKDAIGVLVHAASSADFDYRAAAARAFGYLGGAGSGAFVDAIDLLHGLKPDRRPR